MIFPPHSPARRVAAAAPAALVGLALLCTTSPARAQVNFPRIGYVYPAGGRQGATFQVTVGGQYLGGATNVSVSGGGVRGRIIDYIRPLTQKEFTDLREKLNELEARRAAASRRTPASDGADQPSNSTNRWTAADDALLAEVRKKLENPPIRQGNPAIAERVAIELSLEPDAEAGERDLRLDTATGISNPLRFRIDGLPEVAKPPAKPSTDITRPREARAGARGGSAPTDVDQRVTLPVIVNGQILPGAVDRYRFQALRGRRVVMAVAARSLIPYLPDAVPGWFQATLTLRDVSGKEVAFADDDRFHPDPVLSCEIPADGDYVLEIKDAIYRGREDFVYRITLGELPYLTSVFPLGAALGTRPALELRGWNLPATTLSFDASAGAPGLRTVQARSPDRASNPVPFAVDTLPEAVEQEPNDLREAAESVRLPLIVNGRIGRPGDVDRFRFQGRAGDMVVAEVQARRLDSPLDSTLRLTDATGRSLAFNDDHEDKGAGLTTHHADSFLIERLPADGTYIVEVQDAQRHGGGDFGYRLRLGPPRPDFALRIVPSTINARPGTHVPITVSALRRDGFTNEITLALKNPPRGFRLSGARVPPGREHLQLTLTVAAPDPDPGEPISLEIEGRATADGRELSRPAIPAEDLMQAFAYRHLVPSRELKVAVRGRPAAGAGVALLAEGPVKLPAGGTARILLRTPPRTLGDRFKLEVLEPAEGFSVETVASTGATTMVVLRTDGAKVQPGLAGNLILAAVAPGAATTARPRAGARSAPSGTLPAIPFEVVPPEP